MPKVLSEKQEQGFLSPIRAMTAERAYDEPRPDGEFTETALANWKRVADARGKCLFQDSRLAPSEAYGGVRAAT